MAHKAIGYNNVLVVMFMINCRLIANARSHKCCHCPALPEASCHLAFDL